MGLIKKLSDEVISKTKAGQVVSDQTDVIKELVENSLDARAKNITIEILENGLKKISVLDDGVGMDSDDVSLCVESYTTSKVFSLEDIVCIKSLGFRGEALHSIGVVSELSVKSRINGATNGTEVIVSDLFLNVPARKKFLKSYQTQYRNILKTIIELALSHCEVGFTFINDGKNVFNLVADQTLIDRLEELFGQNFTSNLFEFSHEEPHFKMHGYLSKPQISLSTKTNQYLYINGRTVKNEMISGAVKQAYGNLLEARSHPPFVIYLELAPELVDVNIDPKKKEVSFINEDFIFNFVKSGVTAALRNADLSFRDVNYLNTDVHGNFISREDRSMLNHMGSMLKGMLNVWSPKTPSDASQILQLNNLYLAYQTDDGLVLVDQHAAHERILFEQFLEAFTSGNATDKIYFLEKPLVMEFSQKQISIVSQYFNELIKMGFDLEAFGDKHYRLTQVPDVLKGSDYALVVAEILENLSHDKALEGLQDSEEKILLKLANKKIIQTLNFLACRSAIKGGEYLSTDERKNLIQKLDDSKGLYTCPHGRPVKVLISWRELGKMFKR